MVLSWRGTAYISHSLVTPYAKLPRQTSPSPYKACSCLQELQNLWNLYWDSISVRVSQTFMWHEFGDSSWFLCALLTLIKLKDKTRYLWLLILWKSNWYDNVMYIIYFYWFYSIKNASITHSSIKYQHIVKIKKMIISNFWIYIDTDATWLF